MIIKKVKMNNLIIGKSQLVEAVLVDTPGYGVQAFFDDIPNISKGNIKLYGIEAFSADQMSVSPNGLTVISAADTQLIGVTLVTTPDNEKKMENQSYFNLIRSNNGGFIMLLNDYKIDLTKCYMTLNGAGGMSTNECGLFMLYYDLI